MMEKDFGRSFQHYENYYEASKHATNPARFHYAIAQFFYEDIEPEFEAEMDKFLWKMVRPSIAKSKRQSERGGGAPIGNRNNRYSHSIEDSAQGPASDRSEEKDRTKPDSKKKAGDAFVPPTVEEVEAYATQRGFIDPKGFALHFVTYYTEGEQKWHLSNGKPMKDWKKTVITWELNNKNKTFSLSPGSTTRRTLHERKPDYL